MRMQELSQKALKMQTEEELDAWLATLSLHEAELVTQALAAIAVGLLTAMRSGKPITGIEVHIGTGDCDDCPLSETCPNKEACTEEDLEKLWERIQKL